MGPDPTGRVRSTLTELRLQQTNTAHVCYAMLCHAMLRCGSAYRDAASPPFDVTATQPTLHTKEALTNDICRNEPIATIASPPASSRLRRSAKPQLSRHASCRPQLPAPNIKTAQLHPVPIFSFPGCPVLIYWQSVWFSLHFMPAECSYAQCLSRPLDPLRCTVLVLHTQAATDAV
jgi:hypothetical protein